MSLNNRSALWSFFLILVLCLSLVRVNIAMADAVILQDPPAEMTLETEPPVESTSVPEEIAPVTETVEETSTQEVGTVESTPEPTDEVTPTEGPTEEPTAEPTTTPTVEPPIEPTLEVTPTSTSLAPNNTKGGITDRIGTLANLNNLSIGGQSPNPVNAGNSAEFTVTVGFTGNSNACTVNLSLTATLPSGVSASFNPTPLTRSGISGPSTLTSTLTFNTSVSTPAGSTAFTVHADTSSNCQTTSNLTVGGTLVISAPPPPGDTTPPVITPNVTGTSGANGWYTSDVNVSWIVTDPESGIASSTGCGATALTVETTAETLTCSATNGAGQSNSNSVTIKIDKTPPTASLAVSAGTLGSNGWYTSDVTIQTNGSDSVSSPVTCTPNQFQTTDTAGATFNGSCTNDAGLTANASPLTIKLDKTGPAAALSVTAGTPGANGWYTSDVTVQTSGSDSMSGLASCTADQFQTAETSGTIFNGSCTDNAGNTTNASPLTIKLDKTAPTASLAVSAGTLGNNGWYVSDVTVSTSGSDSVSSPVTCTADQFQTTDTAGATFNGSCTNDAGLSANASPLTIKLDKTGPTIAFVSRTPANGNGWNNGDVTVNWSCTDGLSGVVNASVSTTISTEGANQSATGTCEDLAGSTSSNTQTGINIDKTDPALNLPPDMLVEAADPSGAAVTYSVSASDNLDPSPSVSCSPASGSVFPLGITMVNCTATDLAGNSDLGNFLITVQDTTPPVISPHPDVTVTINNNVGTIVTYSLPAATDLVSGSVLVSCSPASGSFFTVGTTTVTCNATDNAGNAAVPTTFAVIVVYSPGPPTPPTPPAPPTPGPSDGGSGGDTTIPGTSLLIPVTGSDLIELDCLTIVNRHSVKITFINLCNYKATIGKMDAATLPGPLPGNVTFVMGLDVLVLDKNGPVKALPFATGVQLDFPAGTKDQFAVLYWLDEDGDGKGEWIEITQELPIAKLWQALRTSSNDEFHHVLPSFPNDKTYNVLTTDKTGIFVLVKK